MGIFNGRALKSLERIEKVFMTDTCVIQTRQVTGRNEAGEEIEEWSESSPTQCAVYPVSVSDSSRETHGSDYIETERQYDIRLPVGTALTRTGRVKITHRYGELLATPWILEANGDPVRHQGAVVARLRSREI